MSRPQGSMVPESPSVLAEGEANQLLLIAGGAIDGAARLLVQGSAPSLKSSLLELLRAG
ncbi:MAG: hypothetical protein ACHQAV_01270 [Solirubrobacterales bacterium]